MFKFINGFKKFNRSQKGITGLETAIILIAFVTVASVLAYSVLSAGIFSSEKGKAAVYSGLDQAQASMEVRGSVYATANAGTVETVQFTLASVLQDAGLDMTAPTVQGDNTNSVVINYTDSNGDSQMDCLWSQAPNGPDRDTNDDFLSADEQTLVTVTLPTNTLTGYGSFTIQVIPPKGAAITIQRTLPGAVLDLMDLH
jgi:archaeal flagellin FlaB